MPWLKSVAVSRHFKAADFQVDLSPEEGAEFKHLILTGPNGSGKTTILREMANVVSEWMSQGRQWWREPFKVRESGPVDPRLCEEIGL